MLGSGMTVKFFPLFFWREVGLSPIKVQIIYVLAPTGIACCAFVAQKLSKKPAASGSRSARKSARAFCWP